MPQSYNVMDREFLHPAVLGVTPAMGTGVTDKLCDVGEMVQMLEGRRLAFLARHMRQQVQPS
jgi:hypothetical protein